MNPEDDEEAPSEAAGKRARMFPKVQMPREEGVLGQFSLARAFQQRQAEARAAHGDAMPEPEAPPIDQLPNRPRMVLPETEAKCRAKDRRGEPEQQDWNQSKDPLAMLEAIKAATGMPFRMQAPRFTEEFTRAAAWVFGDWNIAVKLIKRPVLNAAAQAMMRGNGARTMELLAPLRKFHRNPLFVEMAVAMAIRQLAPEAPPGWPPERPSATSV